MVLSRDIKQIVKKKYAATSEDKKDWIDFTKQIDNIGVKEADLLQENIQINKVPKLDLHGSSLTESNKMVKKFVIELWIIIHWIILLPFILLLNLIIRKGK